ncbi:hypothetical protein [Streptomyces sp. NPDC008141]|uniref:hypothetical protein n=1 Tax=Streptomyces sp. NPDC008141 TaxID=3364815 RepID=UPI0036E1853C
MRRIVGIVVAGRESQDPTKTVWRIGPPPTPDPRRGSSAGALDDGKAKSCSFRGSSSMAQEAEVSVLTVHPLAARAFTMVASNSGAQYPAAAS